MGSYRPEAHMNTDSDRGLAPIDANSAPPQCVDASSDKKSQALARLA